MKEVPRPDPSLAIERGCRKRKYGGSSDDAWCMAALPARARSLDGGVEREQVGLRGDALGDVQRHADVGAELLHLAGHPDDGFHADGQPADHVDELHDNQ